MLWRAPAPSLIPHPKEGGWCCRRDLIKRVQERGLKAPDKTSPKDPTVTDTKITQPLDSKEEREPRLH